MNIPLIRHKRKLDRLAELGWNEKKTTEYILKSVPVKPYKAGFGKSKTGMLYKLGEGTDSILLRADIDALKTEKGPKHICGHSSHTAALLQTLTDTVRKLHNQPNRKKSVYFLFQPAEETYPSGAKAFIDECPEVIKNLEYAFALHMRPLMKLREIGLQTGPVMARGDYFEINIRGTMAHIKNPEKGKDAIEAAAILIREFKAIQKKYFSVLRINVGVISGGRQSNTIADMCIMKGDVRLKENRRQNFIKLLMEKAIKKAQKSTGTAISLSYFDGYPVLSNEKAATGNVLRIMNNNNMLIIRDGLFSFGCEDYSFISNLVPSAYAFIGTGDRHDIHHEKCIISDAGTNAAYEYFSSLVSWWFNI